MCVFLIIYFPKLYVLYLVQDITKNESHMKRKANY